MKEKTREKIKGVLGVFLARKLVVYYIVMLVSFIISLFVLNEINFWDVSLLKESLLWYVSWVLVTGFKLIKTENNTEFRENYFEDFALLSFLVAMWEFVITYSTFNILVEIIISIVLVILTVGREVVWRRKKYKSALHVIFFVIFLAIGINSILYINNNLTQIIVVDALKEFLLPFVLTLMNWIPMYLFVLYNHYEKINIKFKFKTYKRSLGFFEKIQLFFWLRFNINRFFGFYEYLQSYAPTDNNIREIIKDFNNNNIDTNREYQGYDNETWSAERIVFKGNELLNRAERLMKQVKYEFSLYEKKKISKSELKQKLNNIKTKSEGIAEQVGNFGNSNKEDIQNWNDLMYAVVTTPDIIINNSLAQIDKNENKDFILRIYKNELFIYNEDLDRLSESEYTMLKD